MLVMKNGQNVDMTASEFKVLMVLLSNPGQVFQRAINSICIWA